MPILKKLVATTLRGDVEWAEFDNDLARQKCSVALGKDISPSLWQAIVEVTYSYQIFAQKFREVPVADFLELLTKTRRDLANLKRMISDEPMSRMPSRRPRPKKLGAGLKHDAVTLRALERDYFRIPEYEYGKPYSKDSMMGLLEHSINAVGAVSDWVIWAYSEDGSPAYLRSHFWQAWLLNLTDLLEACSLPHKVSKANFADESKQSPFVRFVWTLLHLMPKEVGRPNSAASLAQAIYRARESRAHNRLMPADS